MNGPTGAQFEITVDDRTLSYRDDRAIALEAGKYLKERRPASAVSVRDLRDGTVAVIGWEAGRAFVSP
jgi:hypothetical protein